MACFIRHHRSLLVEEPASSLKLFAQQHGLAQMVAIVVRRKQHFTQDGLAAAPRNRRKQVRGFVPASAIIASSKSLSISRECRGASWLAGDVPPGQ